jgi:hypothetical protein
MNDTILGVGPLLEAIVDRLCVFVILNEKSDQLSMGC